jgi:hypothetical protein
MITITTSEVATWQRCRQEHAYRYLELVRPVETAATLSFGRIIHSALEIWWTTRVLELALKALDITGVDPYEQAKAAAVMIGYHHRWRDEPQKETQVEVSFELERDGYRLTGKIDGLQPSKIIEHKTSSEDITPGSLYWQRLAIDSQVTNYYAGARALGADPECCLYDVLGKPGSKPKKATPIDKRKYKKKGGGLYANQRLSDETPREYRDRLVEGISSDNYQRGEIVRLEAEELRARREMGDIIAEMRRGKVFRNPGGCVRYGRTCSYLGVCSGTESLDSSKFRQAERKHEELAG